MQIMTEKEKKQLKLKARRQEKTVQEYVSRILADEFSLKDLHDSIKCLNFIYQAYSYLDESQALEKTKRMIYVTCSHVAYGFEKLGKEAIIKNDYERAEGFIYLAQRLFCISNTKKAEVIEFLLKEIKGKILLNKQEVESEDDYGSISLSIMKLKELLFF